MTKDSNFRKVTFFLLLRFLVLGLSTRELFLASITNGFTGISDQKGRNLWTKQGRQRTITWSNNIVKLLTRYSNWKEGTRFETSSENVGESELNWRKRSQSSHARYHYRSIESRKTLSAEFNRTPSVQLWNSYGIFFKIFAAILFWLNLHYHRSKNIFPHLLPGNERR